MLAFKKALFKAFNTFVMIAPMLFAVIGLVGLFQTFVTPELLRTLFSGHIIGDMVTGTLAGAISVGQPFLSYIIGGELLKEGVSLYAVTAFILSFVTLGLVQLPMECSIFGSRFTIMRNLLLLVFTFVVTIATVSTLELLQ